MGIATISDFLRHRFIFTLIPAAISLTGFAILSVVHNNVHLQYAALFLAAAGTYSSMPVIVCWFSANCVYLNTFTIEGRIDKCGSGGASILEQHNSTIVSARTRSQKPKGRDS